MQLSEFFTVKRLRFLGIRMLLCIAAVLIYLMLWRPARIWITQQLVYPQVEYFDGQTEAYESTVETGALLIFYDYGDKTKQLQYRPQFGFFFLVALMGLFFVSNHRKPYLLLGGVHLAGSVLAYLFLMAGAYGFQPGFIITDAIAGYLVPAISLALVPLVVKGVVE